MKLSKTIVLALFFPLICLSQREYTFDYLTEYDFYLHKDSIPSKKRIYVLTNSKNNGYYATYTEIDSLNFVLYFLDYNGISAKAAYLKSTLANSSKIHLDCEYVNPYSNLYKYKTDEYDFSALKDTVLLGKTYLHYRYKSNNPKREKRKKFATNYYIIDPLTNFHLPYLNFSTAYEEWKINKSIPNGIIHEFYQKSIDGDILMKNILIHYKPVDIKLTIPLECDYIETPSIRNKN